MWARLPEIAQPFLTWLTARPAPGEAPCRRTAVSYVVEASVWTLSGFLVGALGLDATGLAAPLMVALGAVLTCSGLGLFQITVFHRCAHYAVFESRRANRDLGRLLSALFLFKHFDAYRQEHMLHHNARKLLTEEDEFADFVLGMCRLEPEVPKGELWRRVLWNVTFSPGFHARFLHRRLRAAWRSPDRVHNWVGMGSWLAAAGICTAMGWLSAFLLLWVIPVTVLFQIATVGRILIEHRFPEPALIAARGREFVCRSTAGVFPGTMPPDPSFDPLADLLEWTRWWLDMLTVQLFVRVFFLVGDTPCHDFHHRRPAGDLTDYIHARQKDVDAGCPGFPLNYGETWGFFRAIDENLAMLARTPRGALPEWVH
jgi:fatty acid desaturase